MRHVRQQIANTVDVMQAGRNPLIYSCAAFNDCPHKVLGELPNDLKVIAKGLKPVASPDIEVGCWVPKRLKVGVEDILMKNRGLLQLDFPMWRQRFVPRFDGFDFLDQFRKRAKNRRHHVLRTGGAQGVEGMPNVVIVGWAVCKSP